MDDNFIEQLALATQPTVMPPSPEDTYTPEPTEMIPAQDESVGILGYAGDIAKGVVEGGIKAAEETWQFGYDVVNWFDNNLGVDALSDDYHADWVPEALQTETTPGKVVSSISQFVSGFIGAGKVLKGASLTNKLVKLGRGAKWVQTVGQGLVQGAMVDAIVFDPHEERLSNLISEIPALKNPVSTYLAADPNDSKAEGRFKNAIEGLALGVLTEGFCSVVKGYKNARGLTKDKEVLAALAQTAEEADAAMKGTVKASNGLPAVDPVEIPKKSVNNGAMVSSDQTKRMEVLGMNASNTMKTIDLTERMSAYAKEVDLSAKPADVSAKLEEVLTKGTRTLDSRPYMREDMANLKHIKGEDTKNLYQALNDVTRDDAMKSGLTEKKTWSMTDDNVKDFITKSYGHDVFDRLNTGAQASDILAENVVLGRSLLDSAADTITNLTAQLDGLVEGPARTALQTRLDNVLENSLVIGNYLERTLTGAGRTLNVAKNGDYVTGLLEVIADSAKNGSSDFAALQANILAASKKETEMALRSLTPKEKAVLQARIKASAIAGDTATMVRLMRKNSKTNTFWALHNELWLNGVLSGLTTQAVNALSTGAKVFVTNPLEKILGGWGMTKGGLLSIDNKELWREGVSTYRNIGMVLADSLKMAKISFSVGDNILKSNSVLERPARRAWRGSTFGAEKGSTLDKAINTFGEVVNFPSRCLMTTDEFFSQVVYRTRVMDTLQNAAEKAVASGALDNTPEAISQFIKSNFDDAFIPKHITIKEGKKVVRQGAGVYQDALNEVNEALFTTPLNSAGMASKISKATQEHPWLVPIVPFVRTPTNIMRDVANHTPVLNTFMYEYKQAMLKGGRDAAVAKGKVMVGGLLWGSAIMAAANGKITGGGPKDKATRDMLTATTGWRPYSIKIGDSYMSYSRLDPYGMVLGIAADYSEISQHLDESEGFQLAASMLGALAKNLSSKTYMQGISNILQAITDPDANAAWYIKQQMMSYVPALLGQSKRIIDPEYHEIDGLIDGVKDRIPGLSQTLPTRYSWLTGNPVIYHGAWASGLSPIVFSSGDKTKEVLAAELMRYQKVLTTPPGTFRGVKLTAEQMSEVSKLHGTIKIAGKTLEEALVTLFESKLYDIEGNTYERVDDPVEGHRARLISRTIQRYRDRAYKELYINDEELKTNVYDERRSKHERRLRRFVEDTQD